MDRIFIKNSFEEIKNGRTQIRDEESWNKIKELFSRVTEDPKEEFKEDEILYLEPKKVLIHCDTCGKVIKLNIYEAIRKFDNKVILCDSCNKVIKEKEEIKWVKDKLIEYNKKFGIVRINPGVLLKPKFVVSVALIISISLITLLYNIKPEQDTSEKISEEQVEQQLQEQQQEELENDIDISSEIVIESMQLKNNYTAQDVMECFKDSITFKNKKTIPEGDIKTGELATIFNDGADNERGFQIVVKNNTKDKVNGFNDVIKLPVKELIIYYPKSITISGKEITSKNINEYLFENLNSSYTYTDKNGNYIQINIVDDKIISCIVKFKID